jgi:hypothetical protein
LATDAGVGILGRGGNACDAAVAVAAALNVVDPMSCGVGGFGLILLYDAKRLPAESRQVELATESRLKREGAAVVRGSRACSAARMKAHRSSPSKHSRGMADGTFIQVTIWGKSIGDTCLKLTARRAVGLDLEA